MIIGLIKFGIVPSLICRGIAVSLVFLYKRYSAPKVIFNVANALLETCVAGGIFLALGWTDPLSPATWFGAVLVLLVSGSIGLLFISGAILATEGGISRSFALSLVIPLLVVCPLASFVGVLVLITTELSVWGIALAAAMLAAFAVLYRRYAASAQDRRRLSDVYAFAEVVERADNDDNGALVILGAIRERFNAARAALWIPPHLDQGSRLLCVSSNGATAYPGPDDPHDAIRLETMSSEGARLIARRTRPSPRELTSLDTRGVSQLLAVALETQARDPGYLEVCDRNASVLQFTAADVELLQSLATHVEAALRQRQLQDKIRYDAAHDPVTDLPNRFWLTAVIDAHLSLAAQRSLAVIVADIDGFAQVNETLGHSAGDELLRVVARSLSAHAPLGTQVARVGGAQFAVVLPDANLERVEEEAAALRRLMTSRVLVAGMQLTAELTLGIAVAPLHGDSSELLLQRADVALMSARTRGLPSGMYSSAMDEQSLRRLQLGAELADAIDNGEISVAFQPIVAAGTGEIVAVELLSRWTHPRLGPVGPDEFIPLAERIGLITRLTHRVLRTAVQRCQAWLDDGLVISMAINLSAVTLAEAGFVDEVPKMLGEHGFPAELLTFEITEGSFIGEGLALPALERLHDLGVRLSVDDFGTGYSSLSYLRRLPIDEVKIDKSFVLSMSTDPGTSTIARSIIDLAHGLGLRVVAEGVEDELTRDLLTKMGCDFLQGYLVSRPLTDANLSSWLTARTATERVDQGRSRRKLYVIR